MPARVASNNPFPSVLLVEGTTPATPDIGEQRLFVSTSDGHLKVVDDTGAVTDVNGSVSTTGSPSTGKLAQFSGSTTVTNGDLSGDVTTSGTLAVTIANDAVTNAKLANMAAHTFKGNNTGSTGDPVDLTATQLTAELNAMVGDSGSGGTKGLAPAPASGDAAAGKFLKADGTWSAPSGTGAPSSAQYVTLATDSGLSAERVLTAGTGISITDGGANGNVTIASTGSGKIAQVVNTQTGTMATGTTILPYDNTIPQNTEGDQYMSLSITPTNSSNKLRIDVVFHGTLSIAQFISVALFQDSTANALAAVGHYNGAATGGSAICLTHYMTAGTTSATTFKVRAGGNLAGTTTFNGISGGGVFNGVSASSITITEIVP